MEITPLITQLNSSVEYKEFAKKYKNSFLIAGFFVLDFETGSNLSQIDYYIPSENKVAAFTLGGEKIAMQMMETISQKKPQKLDSKINIDLEAIKGILEEEMKNRNITEEIRKIIAVIQNVDGKKVWILSCILSGMEILKAHVDDESETVLMMDKASVLDYLKKIPMKSPQAPASEEPEDIDKQLQQLDKLKAALLKEKQEIMKQKNAKS